MAAGMSRHTIDRLVAQHDWQQLARGIYLAHNGPVCWTANAWAGVLIGGDEAMLADEAAGHLWGLVGEPPGRISVLVPNERHPEQRWPWHFRRTRDLPRRCGTPPRTPVADTIVDLCILQPEHQAKILADILSSGRSTESAIFRVLDGRVRVTNRHLLEVMLGRVREGIHSELEHLYAQDVERAHRLPRGRRQVFDGRFRTDVMYQGLIVELDGRLGHTGSGAFRDAVRDNAHEVAGFRTLRFGWEDVTQRPCLAAAQVVAVLQQQGWPGRLSHCPRCC